MRLFFQNIFLENKQNNTHRYIENACFVCIYVVKKKRIFISKFSIKCVNRVLYNHIHIQTHRKTEKQLQKIKKITQLNTLTINLAHNKLRSFMHRK